MKYISSQTANTISTKTINTIEWIIEWLLIEWIHGYPLNSISFISITLMQNLLLQKPSKNSKSKDHKVALERRFKL